MKTTPLELPEILLVEPRVFGDARGYFFESYRRSRYASSGIDALFVQDNVSRSVRGTLRGLHYQLRSPQGKLVQAVRGAIFDVAVDIRRGSPSFGKWVSAVLSDENHHQLWVPAGFAHGFLVLSDEADVSYKVTADYDPQDERILLWSDPAIGIAWPEVAGAPLLSPKDAAAPSLERAELPS